MSATDSKSPSDPSNNTTDLQKSSPNNMGARKAAILLTMLGEDAARGILKQLSDHEAAKLLKTALEMPAPSKEEASAILSDYNELMYGSQLLVPAAQPIVHKLALETLSPEQMREITGYSDSVEDEESLDNEHFANAESIAMVLKKEHPQTAALALTSLSPGRAAKVVGLLPDEMRPDVIRRMAELTSVQPDVVDAIGKTLNVELRASAGDSQTVDGQNMVVNLLKKLSPEDEEAIFSALSENDPELSEEIRKKMFVFEDFITLDGRGIQLILKEVDSRSLTLALKTSSTTLREHVLGCMSKRAATMIVEDLEALGPVSVAQVQTAQDDIVQLALRLAAEGKLNLR